ncbi:MAG: dihydrolipoamide acetyltransferase family protein [Alphaproteobacteria bacterium]
MSEFKMPSLGADMDVGTLVEWVKQEGDFVRRGDIVAVVETQKGAIEIEVFENGTLSKIKVQPGEEVPVGTVLAVVTPKGETAPSPNGADATQASNNEERVDQESARPAEAVVPAEREQTAPPSSSRVTPAARRVAEERGIDLASIPVGSSGVIGLDEVEAAARPSSPSPDRRPTKGIDLAAMRKAIAAAMTRSHRDIPHYWVGQTIDLTRLFEWLATENLKRTVTERLLFAVPMIKAIAVALEEASLLNGHFVDDEYRSSDAVHIGVATALRGGGLIAPALLDVNGASLDQIREGLTDMVKRARAGRLKGSEMTSGTITFSSLGEDTSDTLTSLIYPPQVAIVGCGAPTDRPHVVDGNVVVRRLMNVTVAGDHRVSDGRSASQFLVRLKRILETLEGLE